MNEKEVREVFDGLMLGDGNLTKYKGSAYYSMNMSKRNISIEDHLKYERWLRDNVFSALGIKATVSLDEQVSTPQTLHGRIYGRKKYQVARLWTERIPLLADCWDEWYIGGEWVKRGTNIYIHGAAKVLPRRLIESVVLPTQSLAHWFLCDGGSSRRKDQPPTVNVTLSTHGFSKSEVYHLLAVLNNMGIATLEPEREKHIKGSGLVVWLAQSSVDYFMSLVGPHIAEIFGDSIGPSYKDMIRYKYITHPDPVRMEVEASTKFNSLRSKLARS